MKDFLRKSSWSLSSVAAKSLGFILINKIIAIQFGPGGITLLAHFQNLISLITQIPNDGVNRGIIKYWSGKELDSNSKQSMLLSGFIMNLAIFIITLVLVVVFNNYFLRDFDLSFVTTNFLIIALVAIFCFIIHLFLISIILSFQQIKIYALINILSALLVVIGVYYVSKSNKLELTLLSFIILQGVSLLFSLFYVIKQGYIKVSNISVQNSSFKKLGEFVLMAMSVLIFGKLTDFIVRDFAIQQYGLHQTGLWQSVVKISEGYMMLFINTVGVVYYPQVSALVFDTNELRKYLKDILRMVVVISTIGLLAIFIFRVPILTILYNADFIPASDLIPAQLIGDFFCIIAYLLSYIISAQARTRTFILLQAGSAILYFGLIYIFTQFHGIMGLPIAHAVRYGILVLVLIFLNKRILF